MKWIQYKVHTTTDAADIIGELPIISSAYRALRFLTMFL